MAARFRQLQQVCCQLIYGCLIMSQQRIINSKLEIESELQADNPRSFGREITNFPSYLVNTHNSSSYMILTHSAQKQKGRKINGQKIKVEKSTYHVPEKKSLYDMSEIDEQNQKIPEEVSWVAKEIFDACINQDVSLLHFYCQFILLHTLPKVKVFTQTGIHEDIR